MAGGAGTRFWPLSREKKPKQFLPVISSKTMIEETVNRLLPRIAPSDIYTIANPEQTEVIKKLISDIPKKNLLVEPQGKNTAPSLMLATAFLFLKNPSTVIVALPADHLIQNTPLFLKKLMAAAEAAEREKHLITFGIPPDHPATGYGYIQFSLEDRTEIAGETFYAVERFKEKPDAIQAKSFLKAGNYFWNSGMFVWRADIFAQKLEEFAPVMFSYWKEILEALKGPNTPQIEKIFDVIPPLSIDYALMEKARGVLMCEGNFGWSDVGAWSALFDIWNKEEGGNALKGESIALDSENCLLYSPHKFTALIGLKDLIIVDTEDALLICRKDQDQRVKEVVDLLKKKGTKKHL